MSILAMVLVGIVALLHIVFLIVEAFLWESRGPGIFKTIPREMFTPTKTMMLNQGIYNGFLAAGLIWSLFISNPQWQANIALFFLGCVIIAGIVGAATVSRRIFFIQAAPAIVAAILVLMS